MFASARGTGDEVADSTSVSSGPQSSKPHISEESPSPLEYDPPAHSIVKQSHPVDSVGPEVNTPGQNAPSPPAKCDDDIWKSTPHEIELIGPMGTEANLHALMSAKTPHGARRSPHPAGSAFTHELTPVVLRARSLSDLGDRKRKNG